MGGFNGGGGDTADFGRTTPTKKEKKKTASVEVGLGKDRMSNYSVGQGGTRDEGNNNKSIEQPKVSSQMNNTDVKSKMIVADKTAPTEVEMSDDEYALATNKKGRKKTILTSMTGDNSPVKLSKKTLLGG